MRTWIACCLVISGLLAGAASGLAGEATSRHDPVGLRGEGPRCPRGDEDGYRARRLLGKLVHNARRAAGRRDCSVRVVKRNGKNLAITDDLEPNRINVAVRDRRVTGIRGVF